MAVSLTELRENRLRTENWRDDKRAISPIELTVRAARAFSSPARKKESRLARGDAWNGVVPRP